MEPPPAPITRKTLISSERMRLPSNQELVAKRSKLSIFSKPQPVCVQNESRPCQEVGGQASACDCDQSNLQHQSSTGFNISAGAARKQMDQTPLRTSCSSVSPGSDQNSHPQKQMFMTRTVKPFSVQRPAVSSGSLRDAYSTRTPDSLRQQISSASSTPTSILQNARGRSFGSSPYSPVAGGRLRMGSQERGERSAECADERSDNGSEATRRLSWRTDLFLPQVQNRNDRHVSVGGQLMELDSLKATMKSQRTSCNLYSSSVFFPSGRGSQSALSRDSILMAPCYICLNNYGCQHGACCSLVQTVDIQRLRDEMKNTVDALQISQKQMLHQQLLGAWDANSQKFQNVNVQLGPVQSVSLCITAWSLVHGFTSHLLREVASMIVSGENIEVSNSRFLMAGFGQNVLKQNAGVLRHRRRSSEFTTLREFAWHRTN